MGLWRGLSGGETPRCPGATNRLAFPPLPFFLALASYVLVFQPRGWPPGGPACPSSRRPPRLSPAPCCPGAVAYVSSAAADCPSRSALPDSVNGGEAAPAVACRLPGVRRGPAPCLPPPPLRRLWRRCVRGREVAPSPRRAAAPFGKGAPELPSGSRPAVVILPRRAASRRVCPGCPVARSPRPPSGRVLRGDGPARPPPRRRARCALGRGRRPSASPPIGKSGPPCRCRAWFFAVPPPRSPSSCRPSPLARRRVAPARTLRSRSLLAALGTRPARVGGDAPRWRALPAHRALLPG